jgi:hypothetical protein
MPATRITVPVQNGSSHDAHHDVMTCTADEGKQGGSDLRVTRK